MAVETPAVTLYLARLFSLSCLVMCAAMAARPKRTLALISGMMQNEGLVFSLGVMTLIAGIATLVGHHQWSSPLAVFVTGMGWLMAAKGLALMVMTGAELAGLYRFLGYERRFLAVMTAMALISAAIAWESFA
jgi:uncharacterized integral membrane protein